MANPLIEDTHCKPIMLNTSSDGTGTWHIPKCLSNGILVTSTRAYLHDIVAGNVPGAVAFRIQGINDDVDNAKEDLWSVGGTYVFPTTGMQMELTSSSDQDSDAGGTNPIGTGIRTVELFYLDAAWAEQSEVITLDGTAVVTTSATDIFRVNKMPTKTTGTGLKAAGDIDIRHLNNTPIYGRIPIGENNLHQAICTVPIAKTLHVVSWQPGIGHNSGNRYGRFELSSTSDEDNNYTVGIFFDKDIIDIQDMAIFVPLPMHQEFPAKTDVKVTVTSDAAAANALTSVSFEGWLQDD